jgi:hypothetical protein
MRMPRVNKNSAVTIREIEYSIRIKDKESSFAEMLDILREELTAFRRINRTNRPGTDSTIRDFIQTNIERSIVLRENTRVYFLNYKEKEGSLRIGFTLLIITNYINYASLRQALDSHIKDSIAGYFEELLERHIPVNVTVQSTDNEIVTLDENDAHSKQSQRPKRDILTRILALSALVISLVIGSIFTYKAFNTNHEAENAKLKEDYINALLEKKIIEAVKDQKFTINLYKIADTVGTAKTSQTETKSK